MSSTTGSPFPPIAEYAFLSDCHTGALIAARQAGASWPEACRRANAAAAIKITRRGPDTAPTTAEVDEFLVSGQF